MTAQDRILACFHGLATGDAIGKQTETLSRQDVSLWYPGGIRGFEGTPGEVIPRYAGNPRREWRIGETTDDTERSIAVARAILQDGDVRHTVVGEELLKCRKSVHPGVRSLWEFHQAGDPGRIAQGHDGCGAAVRVAPVGVRYSSGKLDQIVAGAYEASIPTHGGRLAISAAAAVAAAVSAAIDGLDAEDVGALAAGAAGNGPIAQAILSILDQLGEQASPKPDQIAAAWFPNTPLTIVPLAIALATQLRSAEGAILLAANVGGDADSVASIAGAIAGAMNPDTVNPEWRRVVEEVNGHDLSRIAEDLGKLRD